MKLYNTSSKQVETISSLSNDSKIGVYACGPTVYDYAHIGHMRKYTMDDVLVRTLEKTGWQVNHVMNITDVGHLVSDGDTGEDKMEKGARKTGKTVWEVAQHFEEDFWQKLDRMEVRRPDTAPRATDHIAEQIAQVQALKKNGFTYEIPGDGIYFDTSQDPHYGELARLQLEEQKEGARIGVTEGKRNPADFALWKFSPTDQQRAMEWDSPWGKGFPGWHIECSAMSMCYLGEQFEIHTGGIDHIPVHHTNEIAQAENATGKRPFVQYWVHHNFLLVDGQKMSKSLENFYTLDDVEERGFSPMALKMLFLSANYRDELNFTWESLAAMQKGYEKLQRKAQQLLEQSAYESWEDVPEVGAVTLSAELQKIYDDFVYQMTNDLKTPQALATVWKLTKCKDVQAIVLLKEMFEFFWSHPTIKLFMQIGP
ncbi:cysteine--tRNA ligase [Candidatus Woesebacteria bacterium]|nr:cysteine--tRNA ligase [Candidatus Woesebacteria bacterium]